MRRCDDIGPGERGRMKSTTILYEVTVTVHRRDFCFIGQCDHELAVAPDHWVIKYDKSLHVTLRNVLKRLFDLTSVSGPQSFNLNIDRLAC